MGKKIIEKQIVNKKIEAKCYLKLFNLFLLTFFVTLVAAPALVRAVATGTATVSWDKSPEPDIKGYKVFYSTVSGNHDTFVEIDSPDQTSYTFNDLEEGNTYYFSVVAVDMAGQESEPSDEVSKTIPITNLPPEASLDASATEGIAPFTVSFDASRSSDPNQGDQLAYAWDFGDGSTGSGATISHTFERSGSFTVKLTVTDSQGAADQATLTITVADNQAPTARFTPSRTGGFLPVEVSFDAGASSDPDGSITEYAWNFGDGTTATGRSVTHSFDTEGNFSVTLTVTDDKGAQDESSVVIEVVKGYTYTWKVGMRQDAQLHGIEDTYIDVNSANYSSEPLLRTYVWPASEPANSALIKMDLSRLPRGSEIKSALLRLYMAEIEAGGGDADLEISVHKIINVDPVLDACTGQTYDGLNAWSGNSVRSDGVPMAQGDIQEAEDRVPVGSDSQFVTWNITDMVQEWVDDPASNYGLLLNPVAGASSDTNRYFASSEYQDEAKRPVIEITFVSPEPLNINPRVELTASGETGRVPFIVDFTADATDPDGSIEAYEWSVDGAAVTGDSRMSYEFTETGTHTVTVKVTDNGGLVAEDSVEIVVVDNQAPTALIQADHQSGKAPLKVVFDGSGSNDPDGRIISWRWDFGDGTTATGQSVSHEFGPGDYQVVLTVTDDSGDAARAEMAIHVDTNTAPEITLFETDSTVLDNPPWDVTFRAEARDAEDGSVSLTIDFGDGASATQFPALHRYNEAGSYTVTLTAEDSDGNRTTSSMTIELKDLPPQRPTNVQVSFNR
jgi:PKD repeat protein